MLDSFMVYEVSGADAVDFLHGQVTADVKGLRRGESAAGAYCTPKGRVLATFRALRDEQGFKLVLPRSGAGVAMKRLSMYVLRAKVVVRDVSTSIRVAGIAGGRGSEASASESFDSIPLSAQHRLVLLAADSAERAKQNLGAAGCQPVAPLAWKWLDIAHGIPWIVEATQDAFTPHMLNLDLSGAVSFQKGCYPGQEIVARTQYRGEVKRRLVRAQVQAAAMPQPGEAVFGPDMGTQTAGTVIDAAPGPTDAWEILAVMQKSTAQSGGARLGALDGPPLTLLALPYALS